MVTSNDITGDNLHTGSATDSYRKGWERIFGKKNIEEEHTTVDTVIDSTEKEDTNIAQDEQ